MFNLLSKIGLFGAQHVDTPIFSTSKIGDNKVIHFPISVDTDSWLGS